ncbi:hypothetical protein RB2700 [Rhodopirellula baltica SH 1]|uniref:Uncharacterized protein n=1 Tax=Rhodopirellula baltica (strain DSM 10527 / NCIMB 13988 / SH1) TaxID=243090 RepID=Q7UVE0_RHOBA|nr:hypothetical protein RB2700 [Rhodopirellula baltica SH 1]
MKRGDSKVQILECKSQINVGQVSPGDPDCPGKAMARQSSHIPNQPGSLPHARMP